MYKLLIVDDEIWIRQRLCETVDWKSIEIDTVLSARNGKEALEISRESHPDLLITDIRMPIIDGIGLLKNFENEGIQVKTIILSGYDEFQYAQQAMKFGVKEYLLKPIDAVQLLEAAKRCINEIKAESKQKSILESLDNQIRKNRPLLKKYYLHALLADAPLGEDLTADLRTSMYSDVLSHICLVTLFPSRQSARETEEKANSFIESVLSKQFFSVERLSLHLRETAYVVSSVLSLPELEEKAEAVIESIRREFGKTDNEPPMIGRGCSCESLFAISVSFRQAHQAVQGFKPKYDNEELPSRDIPVILTPFALSSNLERIKARINEKDREGAKSEALELLGAISRQNPNPLSLKILFSEFFYSIIKDSRELSAALRDLSIVGGDLVNLINGISGIESFESSIDRAILLFIGYMERAMSERKPKKVIDNALDYMRKHFPEPISLCMMADMMSLNPSYFSKLFAKETGKSFVKVLKGIRMQHAVELMKDPSLKIYEIAERCGFSDVQYFSRVFKEEEDMSPTEFRDKIV
ncbi:MAG: response regulator transcription factor [Sphaerochaetaceae bacterium]